ncbi:MAG: hypothetical protein P0Y53_19795 [Candidatus Pseudobacter hemicellulosilyticus]|uniref:Uncharacterized protein n=1 Tax=Candidatus Pseudobacter hemicellulosilyticus TaxID=3121375 RepID=A0AAJ5WMM7_9BACT|nr:MAG: hypothetical protein P0Y53_19795 [Pseudobacter sp.]
MSGSGGGSGYIPSGPTDCEKLSIKTQLASPVVTVISKLKAGEILDVHLASQRGPVQVVTAAGEIAGAVLPPDLAQLIECIAGSHQYQAKVLDIKGGNCQILITHK